MRKIALVTSTRAEYGIMSRLIDKIENDSDLELQLLVTGMHLSDKFGKTINEIKSPITKKIDIEKLQSTRMTDFEKLFDGVI